ncbi:MAG: DbpA RNA binding domain-containing protein, partial [Verrucomicrobia bacterium]|nr:DbpA RNA binding domain-containing protein [Verrucomicrobiota bacterium]
RAGRKGQAFTFVSGQEIYKLQSMVRWAKLDIRRGKIPSLDEVEEARTSVFFEKIRATLDEKKFKPHDRMIDRLLDQGYASTDICSALISMLQGATGGAPSGPAKPAGAPNKPAFGTTSPASAPAKAAPVSAPAAARPTPAAAPTADKAPAKGPPSWAKPVAAGQKPKPTPVAPKPAPVETASTAEAVPETAIPPAATDGQDDIDVPVRKSKYERPARTGREPGMKTIFLNIGRKQLVTPADIVGKIAGVTRLPANVVGALDIHQRHTLADVAEAEAEFIVQKLAGIKLKGISLEPAMAGPEHAKQAD